MNIAGKFTRLTAMGHEQLTGIGAATALSPPDGARMALIRCEAQNVRWRDDGTAPLATVGMLLTPSDDPLFYTSNLGQLRFIESAIGGIVNVAYYS